VQVDIDQGELDKAPRVGQVLCCDVAGPAFPLVEEVDLAFSKFLAEHVHDAPQFLRNVSRMLKPGRMYVQLSPCSTRFRSWRTVSSRTDSAPCCSTCSSLATG
jgi:hypothetical protein